MIAGMEWATEQLDADVVSMSLSGGVTDGTDPLSQAVNSLTASTGALFVVAAGNNGGDLTVGSLGGTCRGHQAARLPVLHGARRRNRRRVRSGCACTRANRPR
jgi:subtilisin family serine protease